jgi:hypothetical protein
MQHTRIGSETVLLKDGDGAVGGRHSGGRSRELPLAVRRVTMRHGTGPAPSRHTANPSRVGHGNPTAKGKSNAKPKPKSRKPSPAAQTLATQTQRQVAALRNLTATGQFVRFSADPAHALDACYAATPPPPAPVSHAAALALRLLRSQALAHQLQPPRRRRLQDTRRVSCLGVSCSRRAAVCCGTG